MICLREPGLIDSTSLLRCCSHYSQTACGLYGKVKSLSKIRGSPVSSATCLHPQPLLCHFLLHCQAQILSACMFLHKRSQIFYLPTYCNNIFSARLQTSSLSFSGTLVLRLSDQHILHLKRKQNSCLPRAAVHAAWLPPSSLN